MSYAPPRSFKAKYLVMGATMLDIVEWGPCVRFCPSPSTPSISPPTHSPPMQALPRTPSCDLLNVSGEYHDFCLLVCCRLLSRRMSSLPGFSPSIPAKYRSRQRTPSPSRATSRRVQLFDGAHDGHDVTVVRVLLFISIRLTDP